MQERKQKILPTKTCPQKDRTESEGYVGGQTYMGITENNLTNNHLVEYGLLEFHCVAVQPECSVFTGETQQRRWWRR